jgi:calcineurin-like phosphoesterase family protein
MMKEYKKFYVSDTHFFHRGILKHASRPFLDVHHMNEALMDNWNHTVGPWDEVFFLGDFCFREDDYRKECEAILSSLNGVKHLVIGNHDPDWVKESPLWESVSPYLEIQDGKRNVVLFHYPIEDWNRKFKGSIHLYGHVHETPMPKIDNRFCVCVEKTNYKPMTLDQILASKPN